MFHISTRTSITGLTAICLSLALTHQSKAEAASCPSPIPFGLTTALTGNLALLGTQARNGVEFAVDEINGNGGIGGKKLALTTEDTGASSTDALNAMNRIIEGKPLVIFGSMISPHVFAQTEGVNKSETPFLVGATNAKVTAQGSKWLFRTHVHDGQLAELIPEYLVKSLGKTKPGIMAVADDYGLGASKGIQAALAKLKVEPVGGDFLRAVGQGHERATARDQGQGRRQPDPVRPPRRRHAGHQADERSRHQADHHRQCQHRGADHAQQPVGGGSRRRLCHRRHDPADLDGSENPRIGRSASRTKYKVPADNFTVSYYDTVYMVKSIIEKVGCDKAAIRDALAATKDWKGMLISYQADAQGDLAHTLGIYRNKGKTPELTGPIKESGY